jgi:VanZ family protein
MKWLTILFTLFIVLIIVLADLGKLETLFLTQIPYADKAGHFILYGILALLVNLSLFRAFPLRSRTWLVLFSGLILALLIGIEEFSQQYFSNRTFSLSDLTASYLGVFFFSWLALRTGQIS